MSEYGKAERLAFKKMQCASCLGRRVACCPTATQAANGRCTGLGPTTGSLNQTAQPASKPGITPRQHTPQDSCKCGTQRPARVAACGQAAGGSHAGKKDRDLSTAMRRARPAKLERWCVKIPETDQRQPQATTGDLCAAVETAHAMEHCWHMP